ncbi:hypothetical protein BU15DRAFT_68747 [Melanogaster broomeanus]|nr:hypothetical protein BU15DRAFT_68747 [Melanogaster broomeanus]
MSDLLYPEFQSIKQYVPEIIHYIPILRYSVDHQPNEPMAIVYEARPPTATPTVKTKVPGYYYTHLHCFFWRYYLFSLLHMEFNTGTTKKRLLLPTTAGFMQRMLIMMDTVVEQLLGCMELGDKLMPESRFHYFDHYLVTEFVVGRHEPDIVEDWRKELENYNFDLERIDPELLDWAEYNRLLGNLLNGTTYGGSVDKIGTRESRLQLLDALGQWYKMSVRKKKVKTPVAFYGNSILEACFLEKSALSKQIT